MKKLKGLSVILMALFLSVGVVATVYAEEEIVETDVVESGIEVPEDVAEKVEPTAENTVLKQKNSLFVAGETIDDGSKIDGIGFVAGNSVSVNGEYEYGFHAGNALVVNGVYEKDLFAAGSIVEIKGDTVVDGDAYLAGLELQLSGTFNGNVFLAANEVILNDVTIMGDLKMAVNMVTVNENVTIGETFEYNEAATMTGEVTAGETKTYATETTSTGSDFRTTLISAAFSLAAIIVSALVFILFGKKFFALVREKTEKIDTQSIFMDVANGALVFVLMPMLALVLALTIVGVPITLVITAIYCIALYLSTIVAASVIGEKITKKANLIANTTLALTILAIINLIPFVNEIAGFVVMLYGLGLSYRILIKKEA